MTNMADVPPPGFRGLSPDLPIRFYHRNLPHWRQDGATYFFTFRLADSLPQVKLDELAEQREIWLRAHVDATEAEWRVYLRALMREVEEILDRGHGDCPLRAAGSAAAVDAAWRHFDGERYDLFSLVVMPNHVHGILRPYDAHELEDIVGSIKSFTARGINRRIGRTGPLWQEEYFDRIIRDAAHLRRAVQYIEKNPVKAGITCPCWTTPRWREWLGST